MSLKRAIAVGLICVFSGCQARRTQDCERFVTSVNGVLAAIDEHISGVDGGELTSVKDMRKLSALYVSLGDRISQMKLQSPEFQREAAAYQKMVRSAAQAANQVADALEAEDLDRALSAQNRFSTLVSQEDDVVHRINAFCAQH